MTNTTKIRAANLKIAVIALDIPCEVRHGADYITVTYSADTEAEMVALHARVASVLLSDAATIAADNYWHNEEFDTYGEFTCLMD